MSVDLDDQLAAYGSWLQQRSGADLTAPSSTAPRGDGDRIDSRVAEPPTSSRSALRNRWLQSAAAVLVAVGIGGLVVAQRPTAPPASTVESPIDPPAQLFVLPTDPADLQLTSGDVSTARPETDATASTTSEYVLIGIDDGGSYSDMVLVAATDAPPGLFVGADPIEIDTSTGPALIVEGPPPTQRIAQQRSDIWLLLTGSNEREDLTEILERVTVDPSGAITVQDPQRTVIESFRPDPSATDYRTYYDVIDAASGTTFVVETATSPSALVLGAYAAADAAPTTVNGTAAWILTFGDGLSERADTAIVWRATPNRVVAISADADADEIRAMAEGLEHVTEAAWLAALPGASVED